MRDLFQEGRMVELIEKPTGTIGSNFNAVVGHHYQMVIRFGCCLNVRDLVSGDTCIINADRFRPVPSTAESIEPQYR